MKRLAAIVMLLSAAAICALSLTGSGRKAEVRTAEIKRGTVSETLPITLTGAYRQHSALSADKSGIVKEIYVSEGDSVSKGDALMRFRLQGQSGVDALIVRAEEDGVISAVSVMKGAAVSENSPLFILAEGDACYSASIASSDASRLYVGALISTEKGSCRIEKITHSDNGFAEIIVSPPAGYKPTRGETISGRAVVGEQENVMYIPIEAATGEEIWVMRAGRARKAKVKYGAIGAGSAAVFGLCQGDRVIISDVSELNDGEEIQEAEN